jgi:hypothetical protein
MRRRAAVAALATTAVSALAVPGAHAAATGWVMTRQSATGTETVSVSRDGYAELQRDARGRLRAGYLIDYRGRTVTLLDPAHGRYERLSLGAAVRRVSAERVALRRARLPYIAELRLGGARAAERLARTRLRARVGGLPARAWTDKRGELGPSRVWYATGLPAPPPAVRPLLARVAVGGGAAVSGRVALRVQQRSGGRWKTVVRTRRVNRRRLSRATFTRPPRGLKPGRIARRAGLRLASVPATVTNHPVLTLPDIQAHQAVFAVYWGRRFASEPRTVNRLNSALSSVILQHPFVDGMAQYGVRPGRFLGSATIATDPPAGVGNTDAAGWGAASGTTLASRVLGAPDRWWRVGDQDPLIVLFVPQERVAGGGNLGYHSVTPVETAPLDPLGILLVPVLPFAVVKVPPMTPGDGYIDDATVTLSHETAEAATDPLTFGWRQDNPPGNEQGEVSDICKEGATAPFAEKGRVAGVAVGTYWSNRDRGCVPDPRPSIRITTPGTTITWGLPLPLAAQATSPFDGRLGNGQIAWTLDGQPITPDVSGFIASPPVGPHVLRATVTDTQNMTATATLATTVVAEPPEVTVASPTAGERIPLDVTATLRGSAHDARGALSDDRLTWSVRRAGDPAPVAAGRGSLVRYRFPAEGTWTVTLTATSASGAAANRSVPVTVLPPAGDPSVTITSPPDGAQFGDGYRNPIRFTAQAVTANGDPIAESDITWSDDIDGPLGTGATLTHTLSGSYTVMRLHHVTVTATAPNGHTAAQTIRVWSGIVG